MATTVTDIADAFNGQRFMTANELAVALGRTPGRRWQMTLARELKKVLTDVTTSIKPKVRKLGKRLARVYDLNDFRATQEPEE
jgi:hypothetical protein